MSTATISPITAHKAIAAKAAKPNATVRVINAIPVGEWIRQGDVMLERLESPTKGWKETANRQLAPGTSQGSRHVATGEVKIYTSQQVNPTIRVGDVVRLLGPEIVAKDGFLLTHPEHAHFQLPAGVYRTSFQLDYIRQQAVRD